MLSLKYISSSMLFFACQDGKQVNVIIGRWYYIMQRLHFVLIKIEEI